MSRSVRIYILVFVMSLGPLGFAWAAGLETPAGQNFLWIAIGMNVLTLGGIGANQLWSL